MCNVGSVATTIYMEMDGTFSYRKLQKSIQS